MAAPLRLALLLWATTAVFGAACADTGVHLTTGMLSSCREPARRASTHRRLSAIAAEPAPDGFSDPRWGPHLGRRQYILALAPGTPPEARRALADRLSPAPPPAAEPTTGAGGEPTGARLASLGGAAVAGYLPDDAWLVLLTPQGAAVLSAELERSRDGHALLEFQARHKVAPEWAPVLEALEEQRRRLTHGGGGGGAGNGGGKGAVATPAAGGAAAAAAAADNPEERRLAHERRRDGSDAATDRVRAWLLAAARAVRGAAAAAIGGGGGGARGGGHAWASHPALCDHPSLHGVKVLREAMEPAPLSQGPAPLLPASVARGQPHRQRLVIAVHAAPCPREAAARLVAAAAVSAASAAGSSSPSSPSSPPSAFDFNPAAAAAADWAAPLAALARDPRGCGPPRVVPLQGPGVAANDASHNRNEFSVSACPQDLGAVLAWLSRHPAVHYLHPRGRTELQSNAVATAIMQGGDMQALLAAPAGGDLAATRPEEHPAWTAGLTGKGQVVGIGDSGIDVGSCYFNDPAVPFVPSALPLDPATRSRVFVSATHRKVAYYLGAGSDAVDNVGHGTHTSGSLAGARLDGKVDAATGAAPGARVAFMDLTSDDSGDVNAPDDLGEGYFSRTYAQGARVHSDSWGSNLVFYDSAAASLDRWTHEHDDFVSVVAAGNYGREQRFNSTVTSPATSKNCVAVGATLNLQQGPGEPPRVPVFRGEFSIRHAASSQAQRVAYYLTQASFGADAAQALVAARAGAPPLPVLLAEPRDACGPGVKAVPPAGGGGAAALPEDFVLLVDRGACNFFDKAKHAQAAGARAVVVANTLPEGYFTLEAPEESLAAEPITIAVLGAPLGVGAVLRAALAEPGTSLDASFVGAPAEAFTALPSYENIAQYSSFGPTRPDGRVKPDVVAPGGLVSAAGGPRLAAAAAAGGGDGTCATAYEQGTSMATPVVAGSVALIRQYFTDGYYPAGTKGAGTPYASPSGYLLKAVLLGGASAMQGLSEARLPLEPAPSFRQGFGRVNLTRSLALGGGAGGGGRVQVVDRAEIGEGETQGYCVAASGAGGGGPLTVTLAWYDPPALPSAGKPLVNDLDLSVRVAAFGGALARGNGAAPDHDRANTVERVALDGLPAGPVWISVAAPRVFPAGSKQAYALVVQGKFSGVLAGRANPDPAGQAAPADGGAAACLQLQPPPPPPPDAAAPPPAPAGSQAPVPVGEKQLAADAPKVTAGGAAADLERAVAAEEEEVDGEDDGAEEDDAAAATATPAPAAAPAPAPANDEAAAVAERQESALAAAAAPDAAPPASAPTRTRRRKKRAAGGGGAEEAGERAAAAAQTGFTATPPPPPPPPPAPAGPPASDQDLLSSMMMGSG